MYRITLMESVYGKLTNTFTWLHICFVVSDDFFPPHYKRSFLRVCVNFCISSFLNMGNINCFDITPSRVPARANISRSFHHKKSEIVCSREAYFALDNSNGCNHQDRAWKQSVSYTSDAQKDSQVIILNKKELHRDVFLLNARTHAYTQTKPRDMTPREFVWLSLTFGISVPPLFRKTVWMSQGGPWWLEAEH